MEVIKCNYILVCQCRVSVKHRTRHQYEVSVLHRPQQNTSCLQVSEVFQIWNTRRNWATQTTRLHHPVTIRIFFFINQLIICNSTRKKNDYFNYHNKKEKVHTAFEDLSNSEWNQVMFQRIDCRRVDCC
jgi:hypothetical protein